MLNQMFSKKKSYTARKNEKPLVAAQTSSLTDSESMADQLQKLHFTAEQIQFISNLSQAKPKDHALVQTPDKEQDPISVAQAEAEAFVKDSKNPKAGVPIDKLEKDEQPDDNDDDEKLADNHRKMAKIDLKKEEIKKLEDTHKALTKDAMVQAKSGASKKRVQHNLKIAKNVAKRVEDLKQ